MPPQKACSPEFVRTQLEKILSSAGFARNDRLSGFLRFVVEQELFGRGDELKESIIGVEFFGRPPDYDVRQDSVVRNEAGKLRARLAEYYVAEGAADGLIIELPKGGYKPAFRRIEKATAPVPVPAGSRRPLLDMACRRLGRMRHCVGGLMVAGDPAPEGADSDRGTAPG